MRDTRRMMIWGICGLVVALVLVFAIVRYAPGEKYAGLTLTRETQLDDATRSLLTQRIATTEASITAHISAGEEVASELYESLALDSYLTGDLVTARENYEIILNESPAYYVAWNSYGNVLSAMGDLDNADRAYQQAIELEPNIEEYYLDYAHFLQTRYDDKDDLALLVLEQGVKVIGQTTGFMSALAEWYTEHGDCNRAIAHYDVLRTLNPAASNSVNAKIAAAREECGATNSGE